MSSDAAHGIITQKQSPDARINSEKLPCWRSTLPSVLKNLRTFEAGSYEQEDRDQWLPWCIKAINAATHVGPRCAFFFFFFLLRSNLPLPVGINLTSCTRMRLSPVWAQSSYIFSPHPSSLLRFRYIYTTWPQALASTPFLEDFECEDLGAPILSNSSDSAALTTFLISTNESL